MERLEEVRGGMPTAVGRGAAVVAAACKLLAVSEGSQVGDVGGDDGSDASLGGALASKASGNA